MAGPSAYSGILATLATAPVSLHYGPQPSGYSNMRRHLTSMVSLLLVAPASVVAQGAPSVLDSTQVLLLEHEFVGPMDTILVTLERRVVYRVETTGSQGMPTFLSARGSRWPALVVPEDDRAANGLRRFEVHAGTTGPHVVSWSGAAADGAATLRLYRDHAETRRMSEAHDRGFAVGLLMGGGFHTAYRLDPLDPGHPGGDVESCVLAESGQWFSACIGMGRQALPRAGFSVTWFFLEPRARLASGRLVGSSRTDLSAALRLGQASESGPRHQSPSLVAVGLYVTQHLAAQDRRRGWRLYTAWHYGRLGNVPEEELRSSNRFTAGLMWVP